MAAASPSPLASSPEKTNGSKLSRLLIDGGTTVLRKVFDGYHPPARLSAGLSAHSSTLNALLKKKVLRAAQWDKLFPPGGAAPDSNTFDITLLFLLLTEICGLYRPLSWWNSKPSSSDNSLEANLVRVKFFRNKLYGHVSSTGIDTPTFSSLWQEISVVLVALGLDQAEIDRLKNEKGSAKDYLDILLEWVKSEENINSHLAELHRSQKTAQHSIEEVRDTQLEDHKTIQESKLMLGEVHRSQNTTQHSIEELRQTQLKDRKTLQDSTSMLGEMHQSQKKIHSILEGGAKSQDKCFESFQTGLQEVKLAVGELSKGRNSGSQEDEVLKNLVKSEFKGDIEFHVQRFQDDTRGWIINRVENWLDDRNSQNRVMVICGNAGMGKSVLSAVVCKRMQLARRLCGSHFIQHNNVRYRKPQLMLQSLACHMCHALPDFKLALVEQLTRNTGKDLNDMGVEELFALLFKEPLGSVEDPERNMLIVIDGLDESEYSDRNELLEVIANHFCKLPTWIRFLVTSRPERNIANALKHLQPFQLEADDEQNQNDIKRFIGKKLECIPEAENTDMIVQTLVEKSEGLMLYAYFLLLYVEENPSVLKQGDDKGKLPLGISSVYHRYFKRLEDTLKTELGIEKDSLFNFLSALAASREPLPIDFASRMFLPGTTTIAADKRKLAKVMDSISSLLPIQSGLICIFHKSIVDWLTDERCYGAHDFIVDEKEGHEILAGLCTAELDSLFQRRLSKSIEKELNDTTKYALRHGVQHMLQHDEKAGRVGFEKDVTKYVLNPELVYAKLCVSSVLPAEDVTCVQMDERFHSLSEETKASLKTLLFLLRKNSWSLRELPHVIFQIIVNDGSLLSLEAKKLLSEKYDEISYMERANKNQQQSIVEARYDCSSEVICFDISADQDYMVCECANQDIQLWLLKTGKMEWSVSLKENDFKPPYYKRPVDVSLSRCEFLSEVSLVEGTILETIAFYRSVTFHPDGKHILPGNLATVYTIHGKQKKLFSLSTCRFSVSVILGNKTTMLTDCPNNSKCLVIWSLDTGEEVSRITRNEDIVCFQCSADKKLLAVSHSKGLLCLFDIQNEPTELGTISTNSAWGFLTFSVKSDELMGLCLDGLEMQRFRCRITTDGLSPPKLSDFSAGEFVFREEAEPFLVGDATETLTSALSEVIRFEAVGLLMRLNSERALLSSPTLQHVSLVNLDLIQKAVEIKSDSFVMEVAFSTNGQNVYVVSEGPLTVTVWDCSSGKQKVVNCATASTVLPVKDGVVVLNDAVEVWDVELSECKRRWDELQGIELLPISEELVACLTEDGKVVVLSTSDGRSKIIEKEESCEILAVSKNFHTIALEVTEIHGCFVRYTVYLSHASLSSSREIMSFHADLESPAPAGLFSPKEEFIVLWTSNTVEVYYATSGKRQRELLRKSYIVDCKFITNQALMVCTSEDVGNFLRMYDVISGEHLATLEIEGKPVCLGVCLKSLLVAVGLRESDVMLIHIHLPRSGQLSQK